MTTAHTRPVPLAAVLTLAASLALPFATAQAAPRAADPVKLSPAAAESVLAGYTADRRDTERNLHEGATSYLAAVARQDFAERTSLTVGSAADCDVRLDATQVAAHHLRVSVAGDSFHVQAVDDTATFATRAGAGLREAKLPPSALRVGRFTLRLSHQRFPAIIVFDPQSPHFAEPHPMAWFTPDLAYRFVAPLTPDPSPDTVIIMSTRGNARRAVRAGWFDLSVKGRAVRLEAHRLLEPGVDEQSVSVFFRDATSGHESYGMGRYVDPERLPDGRWLVDFNNAYNPACATSLHYNCPIPSKANALRLPIRAGEQYTGAPH